MGRIVPLWLRCLALGLAISWLVALGHWLAVETAVRPRPVFDRPDDDGSGLAMFEWMHRLATGRPPRNADQPDSWMRYEVIAYGWPVTNWGQVFVNHGAYVWQTNVDPIVALDVRGLWPPGDLPDPFYPTLTRAQAAAMCSAGSCPPSNCTDGYQRYLPVFPLIGHSMLASLFYGLPFYAWFKWREVRRRRGCCLRCGYSLAGLSSGVCPECGIPRCT